MLPSFLAPATLLALALTVVGTEASLFKGTTGVPFPSHRLVRRSPNVHLPETDGDNILGNEAAAELPGQNLQDKIIIPKIPHVHTNTVEIPQIWTEVPFSAPIEITDTTLAIVGSDATEKDTPIRTAYASMRLEKIVEKVLKEHDRYCSRNAWGYATTCPHAAFNIYANQTVIDQMQGRWKTGHSFRRFTPCALNGESELVATVKRRYRNVTIHCV